MIIDKSFEHRIAGNKRRVSAAKVLSNDRMLFNSGGVLTLAHTSVVEAPSSSPQISAPISYRSIVSLLIAIAAHSFFDPFTPHQASRSAHPINLTRFAIPISHLSSHFSIELITFSAHDRQSFCILSYSALWSAAASSARSLSVSLPVDSRVWFAVPAAAVVLVPGWCVSLNGEVLEFALVGLDSCGAVEA